MPVGQNGVGPGLPTSRPLACVTLLPPVLAPCGPDRCRRVQVELGWRLHQLCVSISAHDSLQCGAVQIM